MNMYKGDERYKSCYAEELINIPTNAISETGDKIQHTYTLNAK